jgi:pantoate--beta-alanine ligase
LKIVRTVAELRAARRGKVALVPTMGALHEGHLSLMRQARGVCETLVGSLFVNPTQFGPNEDFNRYPRDEERDARMAEEAGVDVLFAPSVEEVFPRKTTTVSVLGIADIWEGALRPGHFDGVATVVCKLFNMAMPESAFFGLKDLQQCAVIRRMVEDLDLPVRLEFCKTVREPDGLAMSSRNAYLTADQRAIAPVIYQELARCAMIFELAAPDLSTVFRELDVSRTRLQHLGMQIDYFELVDTSDLSLKEAPEAGDSLIAAVKVGTTRLIDNVQINKS